MLHLGQISKKTYLEGTMSIYEFFMAIAIFAGLATLRVGVPLLITVLIKQLLLKITSTQGVETPVI